MTTSSSAVKLRCLFCTSTAGKRSKEHLLRRDFKKSFPEAPGLAFSHLTRDDLELVQRPISQFDMTLNRVCRECNQGWLNDLERQAWVVIEEITTGNRKSALSRSDVATLGFWAYIRALLRTHISPRGQAPRALFEEAYRSGAVPPGSFAALGASTHYVWEAGTHQSVTVRPGNHYLGFVAFGLGALVFLVSISDSSAEAAELAFDLVEQPRNWFPGRFRRLAPVKLPVPRLGVLTAVEAQVAGLTLAVRSGSPRLVDQLGIPIDPLTVIPAEFHGDLAWR
jgi:hypothetical protein